MNATYSGRKEKQWDIQLIITVTQRQQTKRKSELIGCKCCGSKIARKYLKNNFCPVCHSDLRPETTLNRIAALKAKADKLHDAVLKEETKIAKKNGNVRWLVKIEYHQ